MAEAHKRTYRRPKYTTTYRVKNWREYEQSLRDRADITLWLSQDAIDAWTSPKTERPCGQRVYSDIAMETALTLRWLFHLPFRQTEGFLQSILKRMDLDLPCPDHTTVSRRNSTVDIRRYVDRLPEGPSCLIVDSSGLKVCGQGEWHANKHGEKRQMRWKKLHLGVDSQGWVRATPITDSHDPDPSQVPALLDHMDRAITRCIGDGIYDQAPVYAAVAQHSPRVTVIIPPRKNAVLSREVATAPTRRDRQIAEIQSAGRFQGKRMSGYYAQSTAENAFSRYKRTCGGQLRTKRDETQEREASLACTLLNRLREVGRPQSYPMS